MPGTCRIYANETSSNWNKKCWPNSREPKKKTVATTGWQNLALAKVREIYESSTPNVFTLCHPSVSLIYLFADSRLRGRAGRDCLKLKCKYGRNAGPGHVARMSQCECECEWLIDLSGQLTSGFNQLVWLLKQASTRVCVRWRNWETESETRS